MMIQLLIDYPLLLLFVVTATGYPLGRLEVAGFRLSTAAVLFAGEQTGNDLINFGHATVYPLTILVKIFIVQRLLLVL